MEIPLADRPFMPWLQRCAAIALAAGAVAAYLALESEAAPAAAAGIGAGSLLLLATAGSVATWPGRQRLKARVSRLWRHEFWPWYVFYAPLLPWLAWLGLRHRGIMTFTCVNPALDLGGGVIGESKSQILEFLGADPAVLAHELLPARPDGAHQNGDANARLGQLEAAIEARPELGGWPIILKPDRGERGYGVRLCRSPDEALHYLREMPQDVVAQRYHPGPHECGIFWIHDDQAPHGGRIFSITRKHFQTVTGDGRRTLEALVLADPRLRMQSKVFLNRFAHQRGRVLAPGEILRMSESGNHAQGALFRDGADMVTEALAARIGAMLGQISAANGAPGFDLGRLDVRYVSDDELRRGRGFAIVELNGSTSESTNMYDPGRSVLWAWGVLLKQWAAVYRLGAGRRAQGAVPMGVWELGRLLIRERRQRRGGVVSS